MRFIQDLIRGFRLPFQGIEYLAQHRSLWKWALLPAVVNLVLFSVAFAILIAYIPTLYNLARFESPATQQAWLWSTSLSILSGTLGVLLIMLSSAVLAIVFLLISKVIAAPLSRRPSSTSRISARRNPSRDVQSRLSLAIVLGRHRGGVEADGVRDRRLHRALPARPHSHPCPVHRIGRNPLHHSLFTAAVCRLHHGPSADDFSAAAGPHRPTALAHVRVRRCRLFDDFRALTQFCLLTDFGRRGNTADDGI